MIESNKRFFVALSFPGEYREFVANVARLLSDELGTQQVLYDKFHEAEFARPNLDTHLQTLYHDESELVVVFLCAEYERKEWPGLEWRAIRDLIKKKQDTSIMLIRLDDTDVSGIFSIDGYISAQGREPIDIATLIIDRLQILGRERRLRIAPLQDSPPHVDSIPVQDQTSASHKDGSGQKSKLPQDVRDAINRGVRFFNSGHFKKAKVEFQQAVALAEDTKHALAIVYAKERLADVLIHFDRDVAGAESLLQSCLDILAAEEGDNERADVLARLARVHEQEGDWELSESLLRQSLAISERLGDRQAQAGTLVGLGWAVGHNGRTDEALELNRKAYDLLMQVFYEAKQDDTIKLGFIHTVLSNLFFQRAKIYQRRAEPDDAEKALVTALKWQRKVQSNHDLARLLCELAELKFFKQEWNAGASLLHEAAMIYQEREMLPEFAECLLLMGRVHAAVGDLEKARESFSSAAAAAAQGERSQEAAKVLYSLAHLALEQHNMDEARQLFENAKEVSNKGRFQAECLMELSRLAANEKREDERQRLINEAVGIVKAELINTKPEMERAQLYLTLGWCLRESRQIEEALSYVRKARERFEAANDTYGMAKASYEAAGLLDHLGRKEEARELCRAVLKMIEGKPFFEISAAAHLALAKFAFQDDRDLTEAERLLDRSLELCKQHDLQLLPEALLFKDKLETVKRAGTEAAASIPELLDFLYQQIALCPANKEGYLRFWAFSHARRFNSALRATLGPNIGILTNDLQDFLKLSAAFKPYRDWSILIPPQKYPENIYEIIPFSNKMLFPPEVKIILLDTPTGSLNEPSESFDATSSVKVQVGPEAHAEIAVSRLSTGGAVSRYFFVSLEEESEQYGGAKGGAEGESLALPLAVHELLQHRDVDELKSNRLFFIYYNRGQVDEAERLWFDLAGLQWFRCYPIYKGALPQSHKVRVVASCPVMLPVLTDESAEKYKRVLRNVRKALLELIAASESTAAGRLSDLATVVADLADEVGEGESLSLIFYILAFDYEGATRTHAAIVLK